MRKFVFGCKLFDEEQSCMANETEIPTELLQKYSSFCKKDYITGFDLEFQCEKVVSVAKRITLEKEQYDEVKSIYQNLYPCEIEISIFAKKITRAKLLQEILATVNYRGGNSPYSQVIAYYPRGNFKNICDMEKRPAIITSLLVINIFKFVNGSEISVPQVIADCRFLKYTEHKNYFGVNSPLKIWSTEKEHPCYIPLKFISGRFVTCMEELYIDKIGNRTVPNTYNLLIQLPSKSIV